VHDIPYIEKIYLTKFIILLLRKKIIIIYC